jgi:hypothetical protein
MINSIAGEHIPGSIKLNNVYARYRLDSGPTSPAIFIPLKCVNRNFLKQDSGGTSPLSSGLWENTLRYQIFNAASGNIIQSEHMKSCLTTQKRFLLFEGPGSFKIFFKSAEMLTN